jgi:hypothetical protein
MSMTAAAPQKSNNESRTPIRIERLIISHANPNGVRMPDGLEGKSDKLQHVLNSGCHGDVTIEIEHRPWLRVFRVVKTKRVTRTGKDGKDAVTFEPMGRPFHLPDTWAVSVPFDE